MAEAKRISLRRDGAPYQSGTWQGDFTALSPSQRQEFLALLADVDRAPAPPAAPPIPDGLSYAITIESDEQTRKITARDGSMGDAFQRLEAWLRETLPRLPPQ